MRISGFRCDGCGKEHLLDPSMIVQVSRDALPADWLMVIKGKYHPTEEPWVFCSTRCLRDWLSEQLTANDISLPSEEE